VPPKPPPTSFYYSVTMSDATINDKSATDLKFNGRKVMFTAWKARIIAHLNSKSTEDDYKRVMDDKKPLNLAHSDWKKGRSGKNLKHDSVAARLKLVPKARRTTFRSIAAAIATDIDKKIDELALEVAQAMDMSEFSSQMEKLSVDGELEDDIDLDLALLLGIDQLLQCMLRVFHWSD
ncbi:hypothetical protein DYB26_011900, partial [Aphanomyces astaci]